MPLHRGLTTKAIKCLWSANIFTVDDIASFEMWRLHKIPGLGMGTFAQIDRFMAPYFAEEKNKLEILNAVKTLSRHGVNEKSLLHFLENNGVKVK